MAGRLRVAEAQVRPERPGLVIGERQQVRHRVALDVGRAEQVARRELPAREIPLEREVGDAHAAAQPPTAISAAPNMRTVASSRPSADELPAHGRPGVDDDATEPSDPVDERPVVIAEGGGPAIRAGGRAAGCHRCTSAPSRSVKWAPAGTAIPDDQPAAAGEAIRTLLDEPAARQDRAVHGPLDRGRDGPIERAILGGAGTVGSRAPSRVAPSRSGPRPHALGPAEPRRRGGRRTRRAGRRGPARGGGGRSDAADRRAGSGTAGRVAAVPAVAPQAAGATRTDAIDGSEAARDRKGPRAAGTVRSRRARSASRHSRRVARGSRSGPRTAPSCPSSDRLGLSGASGVYSPRHRNKPAWTGEAGARPALTRNRKSSASRGDEPGYLTRRLGSTTRRGLRTEPGSRWRLMTSPIRGARVGESVSHLPKPGPQSDATTRFERNATMALSRTLLRTRWRPHAGGDAGPLGGRCRRPRRRSARPRRTREPPRPAGSPPRSTPASGRATSPTRSSPSPRSGAGADAAASALAKLEAGVDGYILDSGEPRPGLPRQDPAGRRGRRGRSRHRSAGTTSKPSCAA